MHNNEKIESSEKNSIPYFSWRISFRNMAKLLDDRMDPYAGIHAHSWLDSEHEWTQLGALDAQYFYNELALGGSKKEILNLMYDREWLGRYFYVKYITY